MLGVSVRGHETCRETFNSLRNCRVMAIRNCVFNFQRNSSCFIYVFLRQGLCVTQAGLRLGDLPNFASQVLGFKD